MKDSNDGFTMRFVINVVVLVSATVSIGAVVVDLFDITSQAKPVVVL